MIGTRKLAVLSDPLAFLKAVPLGAALYFPMLQPSLTDYSGNGNHGTITGATWSRRPSGVWALSFDGNDHVVVANATSLQITVWTMELWFNQSTIAAGTRMLLSKASQFYTLNSAAAMYSAQYGDATVDQIYSGSAITASTWYHRIITYDGGAAAADSFKSYRNGVLVAHSVASDTMETPVTNANDLYIGAATGPADYFTGQIAMIVIYNRVLSAQEAAYRYHKTRPIIGA